MLHFQHIEFLLAFVFLLFIIGFYYSLIRWKKKSTKKIGDPQLVKELIKDYSPKKFQGKFLLFSIAFALCVLAVAGLRSPDGNQMVKRKGVDIVIALDVSKSMLAQDIKPNRLERAKQLISRIIDNSADNRIGLVIFAGRAYLQMPLTLDHGAAKMYLSAASPDNIPTQGTVISAALKMSAAAFNPKDKTYKSIILISDGEDHDEDALKVVKSLMEKGIVVNTVGIGSPSGAPIMDEQTGQYKTDINGQTVVTKLNEEELMNIAKAGNGLYQLYTTSDEVANKLNTKLSGIGKDTMVSDSSYASFKEYFQYFLGAAFIFLLIEFFISERKKMKKVSALATVLFLLLCNPSFAQSSKKSIAAGNKAYNEKNYELAEKEYRQALKLPGNNVTASYNLGNVLYRKDNTEEAVKQYDNTIQNTKVNTIKQQAFYNKGVAYQKAKKLPEAILAYKNALLLNQNDEDARQNLQRALKQQQEQQKQKDKKDTKQDKKDNKDQQDKQQQKDQQKDNEPKPQPSRLSKQDAEEKLKSLRENEKAIQDKLNKSKAAPTSKPDKDW
ncbi:MAG: VWA domain-containing protein [Ginsengibacter sp.]